MELFRLTEHDGVVEQVQPRKLSQILNDMLEYAYQQGMLEEQTVTEKDLFDTKIMGELTPPPSVVRRQFFEKYNISPKTATDFYYNLARQQITLEPTGSQKTKNGRQIQNLEKWT